MSNNMQFTQKKAHNKSVQQPKLPQEIGRLYSQTQQQRQVPVKPVQRTQNQAPQKSFTQKYQSHSYISQNSNNEAQNRVRNFRKNYKKGIRYSPSKEFDNRQQKVSRPTKPTSHQRSNSGHIMSHFKNLTNQGGFQSVPKREPRKRIQQSPSYSGPHSAGRHVNNNSKSNSQRRQSAQYLNKAIHSTFANTMKNLKKGIKY